jgi:hypothetical protein
MVSSHFILIHKLYQQNELINYGTKTIYNFEFPQLEFSIVAMFLR